MDEFLSKEDRALVQQHNQIFGTRYRTEPYDLKKPEDFAELLTMVTGEYVDMYYYWAEVERVLELFDESLETYYPAEWEKLHLPQANRRRIASTIYRLRAAADALEKLLDQAEKQCRRWWKLALMSGPDKVLQEVAGVVFRPSKDELKELLSFEFMSPDVWQYNVESSAKAFGQAMYQEWCNIQARKRVKPPPT